MLLNFRLKMGLLSLLCLASALLAMESKCDSTSEEVPPYLYGENIPNWVVAEGEGLFDLNQDRFNYDLYKTNELSDRQDEFHIPHFQAITKDVTSVDGSTSWSSRIALFGSTMFPVCTDKNNVIIAAGLYGKGRLLFSGHDQYLSSSQGNIGLVRLTQNAIQWLAQADKLDGVKLVTATGGGIGKVTPTATKVSIENMDPANTQVYYASMSNPYTDSQISKLVNYVKNGGGLIIAGQVWSWMNGNGGEANAINNNGNRLLKKFGAIMGSNVGSAKELDSTLNKNLLHAFKNLAANPASASGDVLSTLGNSGALVLNVKTSKDPDFDAVFTQAISTYEGLPADVDRAIFCRLTASLLPILLLKNPSSIRKASDYETFPGAVPADAARVTETFLVNGTYAGYPTGFSFAGAGNPLMVSTGLYAPPGELIKITMDPEFLKTLEENHGIDIQIGVHSDHIYHKPTAPRSPQIVTYSKISSEPSSLAANPWGGLIYVRVRHGSKLPLFKITIANGVKAPYFVLGKTNLEDWKSTISKYPAPWGELEVPDQVIFSVPSSVLRDYETPMEFLSLYKDVMQEYNFMQGFEGSYRFRAERLATDIEISAGWLHSGYPVMAYQSIAKDIISPKIHQTDENKWGELHEFGHNSQWHEYTTGDTTEAGCNVYAHYANSHLFNATTRLSPDNNIANVVEWLLGGRTGYGGHISAVSYVMLMERYGYENWRNMNRYYMENPADVKGEKYDVFAYVMAKVMQMDVCPYFEFFTYKLTQRTLETCKSMQKMPDLIIDKFAPVINNVPAPEGNCPLGWLQHGSSCFFVDSTQRVTWDEAENACTTANNQSHLASCMSQEEAFFLTKHFQSKSITGAFHIGIDEQNDKNEPQYLDGSALPSLMPWKASYPRKDGNRCVKMEGGYLYDESCSNKAGFVCKLGPTSCGPKITCPQGWIRFVEHCYWVFYGSKKYDLAVADCKAKDAYLLEINSKDENDFYDALVKKVRWEGQYYWKSYWLGMKSPTEWLSGEAVEFSNWCEGAKITDAIASVANTYCWKGLSKSRNNEAYICEKSGIVTS